MRIDGGVGAVCSNRSASSHSSGSSVQLENGDRPHPRILVSLERAGLRAQPLGLRQAGRLRLGESAAGIERWVRTMVACAACALPPRLGCRAAAAFCPALPQRAAAAQNRSQGDPRGGCRWRPYSSIQRHAGGCDERCNGRKLQRRAGVECTWWSPPPKADGNAATSAAAASARGSGELSSGCS